MIFPTGIFLLSNIFSNSNAVCAAFFFSNSAKCNPAEQPYKRDAEENADAVDADVLYPRAAVGDHRLVELIARGKGDTEDAGKKCESEAAQP